MTCRERSDMNQHGSSTRLAILTYHSLDESGSVISMKAQTFRRQMGLLRQRGYTGIRLSTLLDAWAGGSAPPDRAVIITFDDAYTSVLDVAAPILNEFDYRATVFAVSGFCGGYNDWPGRGVPRLPLVSQAGLRDLARAGFEIGSHTVTHASLCRLSDAQARDEIARSKDALEQIVGEAITAFAYPYGELRREHEEMVSASYRAACGTNLGLASARSPRYRLPRIEMYYYRNPALFRTLGTAAGDAYLYARAVGRSIRSAILATSRT
jgi:peptidoglycan/xylan/chitin deacetylase (PgdA/CDA1 family)